MVNGIVYILHFSKKVHHAQHYVGFVQSKDNLYNRITKHWKGKSKVALMKKVSELKTPFVVSKIYLGVNQDFERSLKNKKKTRLFCPVCQRVHYLPSELPWFSPWEFEKINVNDAIIVGEIVNLKIESVLEISEKFQPSDDMPF